jgi:hypothetical protein
MAGHSLHLKIAPAVLTASLHSPQIAADAHSLSARGRIQPNGEHT